MDETALRAAIIAEALSWEGTPYLDGARIKRVGADCVQLPCAVFGPGGVGIIPGIKPAYSAQHMLHCDDGEEFYLAEIRRWAREIDVSEVKPGDLVAWRFGRVYSHSAIVIAPPMVIHAAIKGGCVFQMNMDQDADYQPARRPRKAFSVFNQDGSLFRPKRAKR